MAGVLLVTLLSCNNQVGKTEKNTVSCDRWLTNDYAANFAVRVCGADTTLFLLNPENALDTLAEFPVQNPADPKRLATISTTHVPMIKELNSLNHLIGVGYADYITDDDIHQRIGDGRLRTITFEDRLNFEVVVDLQPEALMVYPYGNENYDRYRNAGIQVLPIAEYAEDHPLGRTEWIKVMGLLTGQYSKAEAIFKEAAEQYEMLKQNAAATTERPMVFTGSFYKGRWSAPAGESFVAQFIKDAGADYAFAEYPGHNNTELDFEVVLEKISGADYFGKVIHRESSVTRNDFMEENKRFELLRTFGDDQLFYCNTHTSDYFGKGLLEPHMMLRDLFRIFHPELSENPDSTGFVYFKPLSL